MNRMPCARRKGATQGKNKLENGNEGTRIREDERESSPLAGDTAVPGGHAKERVTHSQGPDGKQARVQDTGGRAGLGGIAAGWRRTPGANTEDAMSLATTRRGSRSTCARLNPGHRATPKAETSKRRVDRCAMLTAWKTTR